MMELTENMRQRDDQEFAQLLMRVRTASCTESDVALLQSRVVSKSNPSYPAKALHVFTTNKEVDKHNENHLKILTSQVFEIKAVDRKKDVHTGLIDLSISTKPSETGGLREVVSVGVGARVMITLYSDVADGLANAVCGTVIGINHTGSNVNTILVKFDSDRIGRQARANSQYKQTYPYAVPIQRQAVQFFIGRGRHSVEAQRTQFPLTLAWGCTIHKVQGKTLDTIVVSMQRQRRFMPGQAYVALSRVKSLQSLFLLGFNPDAIRVNPAVLQEMERLNTLPVQTENLPETQMPITSALTISLLNVRSYMEHLVDLNFDDEFRKSDVFCFVETFLREGQQLHAQDLILPDAVCFRKDSETTLGRGGGVMAVASKEVKPTELAVSTQGLECTAITITKATTDVNVVTIYRPPSLSPDSFRTKLENLVRSLPVDTLTVILGDFNIDLLKHPTHSILHTMEKLGFHQHVTKPTTDHGSLLDHIYTNSRNTVTTEVTDVYFSDHDMVSVSTKMAFLESCSA
ncbi:hypothetical protein SKAU_G00413130 [Synaphobranchus kaupii]|uniref:Endonuclease/exonuclease/phosphatase domain-containing protein n=1 Tax=Synaphobranchus kaupii TaxID=118154 RepID=A0A9Q1E863_SYNKA|nr:hypothetical protein SKAU_G00413130 [Synaphobranchus kaupii]